jgi:hypothetical protein
VEDRISGLENKIHVKEKKQKKSKTKDSKAAKRK